MALKTFNIDKQIYEEFSKHCKGQGISMSKKVENFIKNELEILKGFTLEVEKDTSVKKGLERPEEMNRKLHPMGKFC